MSNASENPHGEDLNDYIAECDEHLSVAYRVLLDLEAARNPTATGREPLDVLFRAFHTIKGLSGMVGARVAEEAAHRLEAYLGALRKGDATLTEPGINTLLDGVRLLEAAVEAFSTGGAAPDTAALAAQVARLLPRRPESAEPQPAADAGGESAPAGLAAEKQVKLEGALLRGEGVWLVRFAPSPVLSARGVTISSVRARLQAIGEIIHAEPETIPGGVRFRFLFAAPARVDFHGWGEDGLEVEPYAARSVAADAETVAHGRAGTSAVGIAPAHLVRVDLGRLDDLMRSIAELVLSRARLESGLARIIGRLPLHDQRELEETVQTIERQLRDLREGVMRVRMVPVGDLFARMRLVVRDLTRETGKDVELVVAGETTEIDKFVVERMADPLLHLVRNAVSHGIEPSLERPAAGKSERGQLILRAAAIAGMVVLEVEDDGRGIDVHHVFARARETGLLSRDAPTDPGALLELICSPGFSTRAEADRASGRGVGMDVVRIAVEGLGGSLALESRPGQGSRFTVRLPLTLLVADVLTVAVGDQIYAIPQAAVREVVSIESGSMVTLENNELVRHHGVVLPLLRLGDLLGAAQPAGSSVALVTGEGSAAVAFAADRALGLREVVVRPLADPLVQAPGISGATELGDGRPILILDPVGLVRLARRRSSLRAQARG